VVTRTATTTAILLALALAATAPDAAADNPLLDQAQRAIDDIDPQAARDLVRQALDGGGLDARELRRAHRLAGESAAALGDAKSARDHFLRWLLLDPAASLPSGVSPKLAQPFADASAEAERVGRFSVDIAIERGDDRIDVTLTAHDPLSMVAGMRLRIGDASEVSVTGLTATLPAANATAVAVNVVVTDARGNELSRRSVAGGTSDRRGGGGGGNATGGDTTAGERAGPRTRSKRWPVAVRWTTWTGVALVAGGAAGYFAVQVGKDEDDLAALNANSAAHTFDEAEAIRDRGRKHALYTNVAIGVAGAAAVATILTFVLEPRGSVEIAPAPAPGGATVSATVRF
jgi:hypothetical protein